MWPWKTQRAVEGSLTLLGVRVEDMHAVADAIPSFERLGGLLGGIVGACEEGAGATGGHVVAWDPSAIGGSFAVCAWIDGPSTTALDFPQIAQGILARIRKSLDEGLPSGAPRTRVRVALSRGTCLYVQEGRRVTRVMGDPVNRVHRLADGRPDEADAVVVHPSFPSIAGPGRAAP